MSRVCLITTVLQEARGAAEFMDSIVAQSRRPDRVVVADGGSTDDTVEIMRRYADRLPLTILELSRANRSRGRNAAVESGDEPIIACVDGGCILDPQWLELIVAPLEADPGVDVVAGYYTPEPRTAMERAVAVAMVPAANEVNPETFLPSSRSIAFRREAWRRANGYPEWTPYNEDTVFDVALRRGGARFIFEPQAIVRWRPQGRPARVFRQFLRFARGDGLAGLWFPHYAKAYLELTAVVAIIALSVAVNRSCWWLLPAGAAFYGWRVARRARRRGATVAIAALAPLVMAIVDAAHLVGYTVGRLERLTLAALGNAPRIGGP